METKKLKFDGRFFTAYREDGKIFSKPYLEIVDADGNIIYKEKSHNAFRLDNIFNSDEYLKNLLSNLLKTDYKNDKDLHDLDELI
jgi:hypothetical protein